MNYLIGVCSFTGVLLFRMRNEWLDADLLLGLWWRVLLTCVQWSDAHVTKEMYVELEKLNKDVLTKIGSFMLPINPKVSATKLIVEKCR